MPAKCGLQVTYRETVKDERRRMISDRTVAKLKAALKKANKKEEKK